MSKSYLRLILSGFLFINFLFSLQASDVQPSSALEFQQTTDTRIEVEDNFLRFYTGASERMTIDGSGNVGIGTVTPSSRFHVEDNTGGNFGFVLKNIHDAGHGLLVQGGGTTGSRYIMQLKDAAGTDRVTIKDTGEVGIGTTNPANANVHIYRNATTGGWGGPPDISKASLRIQDSNANLYVDGNSLYSDRNMILGTITNDYISIGTNSAERVRINENGNVGIGTTSPTYKLHVSGIVRAVRFVSDTQTYADFVFEDDYELPTLTEVEDFIEKNNHLPDIPSEKEARANGVDLQKMQAKLLQKIEELTLYVIEQQKSIDALKHENASIKKVLNQ